MYNKVFITNFDQHEEYRRGRAVDRQDKPKIEQSSGALTHTVVEESEEVSSRKTLFLCTFYVVLLCP